MTSIKLADRKKEIHTTEPFGCTKKINFFFKIIIKKKKLNKKDTHAFVVRTGKFLRRLNRICGYTTEKSNQLTVINMEARDN